MSDEYGSDFITISDDEGNSYELEHLDTIEYEGEVYMAFLPTDIPETSPDYGMIIMKVVEVDGSEDLATVDDDEELDNVYTQFMHQLFDDSQE